MLTLRFLLVTLAAALIGTARAADCGCTGPNDKVTVGFKQTAHFAGKITVRYYLGGAEFAERVYTAGSVTFNGSRYIASSYGCGETSDTLMIPAGVGQIITIDTSFNNDPQSPDYTEVDPGDPAVLDYASLPSAPCLQYFYSISGGEFLRIIPGTATVSPPMFSNHVTSQFVTRGSTDDQSGAGSSDGVACGLQQPHPDNPIFNDATDLGTLCAAGASAPNTSLTTMAMPGATMSTASNPTTGKGKAAKQGLVRASLTAQSNPRFTKGKTVVPDAFAPGGANAKSHAQSFWGQLGSNHAPSGRAAVTTDGALSEPTGAWRGHDPKGPARFSVTSETTTGTTTASGDVVSGKNTRSGISHAVQISNTTTSSSLTQGSVIASDIGALNLPIALGYQQGKLQYSTPAIDANAYSPARLSLAADAPVSAVIKDSTTGALRQVSLPKVFADIRTISASAFEMRLYTPNQIGAFDGTVFTISDDTPFCVWKVENPDATPLGRVQLTQTRGSQVLLTLATWRAATSSDAGQMTIARNNEAEIETRTYLLYSSDPGLRGERVQRRSGPVATPGPIVADTLDFYHEFYNWSSTGQIFEALVERIEDPDGAGLDTQYVYYDTLAVAPGSLNGIIYPDGYWERYARFSDGSLAKTYRPVMDNPSGPAAASDANSLVLTITKNDAPDGLSETEIQQEVYANQVITRHDEVYKQLSGNAYFETTLGFLANSSTAYTQSQTVSTAQNGLLLQAYSTNGSFRHFNYLTGYWSAGTETFSQTDTSGIAARESIEIRGSNAHQSGVANQTLIIVTVTDQVGRVLLEETYVNDGSLFVPGLRTDWITRQICEYDSRGLLAKQKVNGNVTYEAGYDEDGRVAFEIDEVGIRIENSYDAFGRLAQTVRKRGSARPDQTTTYTYDAADRVRFKTTTAGTLSSTTEYRYDVAGRQTQVITPDGLSQSTSELLYVDSSGNPIRREVTVTSPSGATTVSQYYRDRQLFYQHGTAVPSEYWGYAYLGSGFKESYFYRQLSDQPKPMYFRVADWSGNVVQESTQNFSGAGQYDVIYSFDGGPGADGSIRGLLSRIAVTGSPTIFYEYDEFGQRTVEGLDTDASGGLEHAGTDPIVFHADTFELSGSPGIWTHVVRGSRALVNGVDNPTLLTEVREQLTGLGAGVISDRTVLAATGRTVHETVTIDRPNITRTTVTRDMATDVSSQSQTQVEIGGLLATLRRPESLTDVTYSYDALDRVTSVDDPVTGTVTSAYYSNGQLQSITDNLQRVTSYTYGANGAPGAGEIATRQDAAGQAIHFSYTVRNEVFRQWGANAYPQEYAYDNLGHLTGLSTYRTTDSAVNWTQASWPSSPPAADTTTWSYDYWSGLLAQKKNADNSAINFTYDSALRLATRKNARNQTATYGYDVGGRLSSVTYSSGSGTPDVTLGYDRAGRLISSTDGAGNKALSYTDYDQLQNETYAAGLLNGVAVARTFDLQHRLSGVVANVGSTPASAAALAYDTLSRLGTVTNPNATGGAITFTYGYEAGTGRVSGVTASRGGTPLLASTRTYDTIGRLTAITNANGAGATVYRHAYTQFDALDHRKTAVREDGKIWSYDYDLRGEVTAARKQFSAPDGGELLAGWQSAYAYDTIGNRMTSDAGGDAAGQNLRRSTYTTNALNAYTQRTSPGSIFLTGEAAPSATVDLSVNEQPLANVVRQGPAGAKRNFAAEFQANTNASAFYGVSRVRATPPGSSPVGQVDWFYLAKNPEVFGYDADGNLTSDDRWTYTWDAENRLLTAETRADRLRPVGPLPYERRVKLEFVYDWQGRRVQKKASSWDFANNAWLVASDTRFVYDQWNCLADLNGAALAVRCAYTWGLDLSGSLYGAGGVGGLLTQTTTTSGVAGDYLYAYDGNGNVIGLLDGAGSSAAEYDYSPFGEVLKSVGAMAAINTYQFGTKPRDEDGLSYYGYRYYSAALGRWISLDPLEEAGGDNLYAMASNDAIGAIDVLGQYGRDVHGYFTYFAALAAGADVRTARRAGAYAWGPDSAKKTNAIGVITTDFTNTFEVQTVGHALTGQPPQPLRDKLLTDIPSDAPTFGRWSHVYEDSYAHIQVKHAFLTWTLRKLGSKAEYKRGDKLYKKGLGHFFSGTIPDKVSTSPALFLDMAQVYFGVVSKRFGGRMSSSEFSQYAAAISRVRDDKREDFIKYIVRPCGDDDAYFNQVLNGLPRLDLDRESKTFNLPGDEQFNDWNGVVQWVTNEIDKK